MSEIRQQDDPLTWTALPFEPLMRMTLGLYGDNGIATPHEMPNGTIQNVIDPNSYAVPRDEMVELVDEALHKTIPVKQFIHPNGFFDRGAVRQQATLAISHLDRANRNQLVTELAELAGLGKPTQYDYIMSVGDLADDTRHELQAFAEFEEEALINRALDDSRAGSLVRRRDEYLRDCTNRIQILAQAALSGLKTPPSDIIPMPAEAE